MYLRIKALTIMCIMAGCFASRSDAAKILLIDGREIEGDIVEQTSEYTTVNIHGVNITYYADELAETPLSASPKMTDGTDQSVPVSSNPPGKEVVIESNENSMCQSWLNEAQVAEEAINLYQKEQYKQADNLLQPLAKQGNLRAAVYLWDIYKNGKGVIRNPPKADQWLQKAIDTDVQRTFFWMSEKDVPSGNTETMEKRIKEACDTRLKAEHGDIAAQLSIVNLLAKYDRSSANGSSAILEWYRKAADQDDQLAQYKLGDYLVTGPKEIRNPAEGMSLLWKAYEKGEKEAIKPMLKLYREEVVSNDNASVNPFLKGNLEFARRLWTSKLEKSTFDQFIASAFEGKDSEMLQYFLDNGADPNASMTDGTTLLTTAVAQNDTESVRLLLEHKADADAPDNLGICPVMKVADSESGNLEILKLLLDHGADPNGRIPKEERPTIRTPLAAAWFHHRQDMMELLVEKGANVNFQSFDGHTLLMWAATGGAYDLVQFLLAHGADPSIKNDAGVTAHHYAEVSPQPDPRIKELLK